MKQLILTLFILLIVLAGLTVPGAETPSDPAGVIGAAKGLAQESDRVLFIVALVMLIIGGTWVIRVFMKSSEKKDEQLLALMQEAHEAQTRLSHSLDKLNETVDENTQIMRQMKAKLQLAIMVAVCSFGMGCAKFAGATSRTYQGTNVVAEEVRFRGFTFLDANSTLAKAKALQSKATQSVGVDASSQESTGKTVSEVVKELPGIIKPAIIP